VFRAFWSQASNNDRILLTHAFCENVARHHYRQNLYWPSKLYCAATGNETFQFQGGNPQAPFSNVPQSLLSVFLSLQPRPILSVEFLGAMSSMYSTWHVSSAALESIIFSDTTSPLVKQRALRAVLAIHSDLGDTDSYRILSRLFSEKPSTDLALSLDAFSLHQESQCVLMKAVSDIQNTVQQNQQMQMNSFEVETLEHEWIESCRHLSQWDVLYSYAEALHLSQVSIEAAAIRGDWENVRRLRLTPSVVASLEMGLPSFKLYDVMISLRDNKFAEADRICALIVQMTLFRWQNMPMITTGCSVHRDLMNLFHRVIEMRESTGMIMEVLKQTQKERSNEFPDLKGILETWRDRLPDDRDDMTVWDAMLLWRTNVFQIIQSSVRNVQDASQLASLHDTPWTVIKLAKAASKRKLPDVALLNLSKLDSVTTMDVNDCFMKLREQIVVCLSSDSELNGGLNIINSTNLEFFDWPQKAELFRLKGIFLERLGQLTAAEQAFSQSVQMCPSNGKGWFSWGSFFYKVYLKEKTAANAVSCIVPIMKAVECGLAMARPHLARVLELLAVQHDDSNSVGTGFQSIAQGIPEWIWLPFLPHLFDALGRRECSFVKPVVMRIAGKYPQAVFNLARYFSAEANNTKEKDTPSRASAASEILDSISRTHRALYIKLSTLNENLACLAPTSIETMHSIFVKHLSAIVDDESSAFSSDAPSRDLILSMSKQLNLALSKNDFISQSGNILSINTSEILREARVLKEAIASDFSWLLPLKDEKSIADAFFSKRQTIPTGQKVIGGFPAKQHIDFAKL
jgi:transformation/transcription domain-associated protein